MTLEQELSYKLRCITFSKITWGCSHLDVNEMILTEDKKHILFEFVKQGHIYMIGVDAVKILYPMDVLLAGTADEWVKIEGEEVFDQMSELHRKECIFAHIKNKGKFHVYQCNLYDVSKGVNYEDYEFQLELNKND